METTLQNSDKYWHQLKSIMMTALEEEHFEIVNVIHENVPGILSSIIKNRETLLITNIYEKIQSMKWILDNYNFNNSDDESIIRNMFYNAVCFGKLKLVGLLKEYYPNLVYKNSNVGYLFFNACCCG